MATEMSSPVKRLICTLGPVAASLLAAAPAAAHDYPTSERVTYVEQCIQDNPGPHYEMISKCSCALDHMAKTVPYDDFVAMETASNASTVAGERGNAIRDSEGLQGLVRQFRDMQAAARKACFIGTKSPR